MGWVNIPGGCTNCGCPVGECQVCPMSDTLYLWPWIPTLVRNPPGTLPRLVRIECSGPDPVVLNRAGVNEWRSSQVGGSYYIFKNREPQLPSGRWCIGTLDWWCNGSRVFGGQANPFGSLPDPGSQLCVSCAGDVRWYSYASEISGGGVECCPELANVAFFGPILYGIIRTVPERFGSDCCCRETDIHRRLTASVVLTGCFTYSWTKEMVLISPGNDTTWQAFESYQDFPNRSDDFLDLICSSSEAETYRGSLEIYRNGFQRIDRTAFQFNLQSCSPFLVESQGQFTCSDGSQGSYRITVSE